MPIHSEEYCPLMAREGCTGLFWRDVVGELLATFFLVSVQCALPLYWAPVNPGDVLQTGLGMGFVVIAIGWGWFEFGGAHMNPAVTMALMIRREITFLRALLYWIVQAAAGIAGAAFVYAITPDAVRGRLGATTLGDGIELWQGFLIEFWITLILVIAVLGSTNKSRKKDLYMFVIPIGLAVALGHFVAFSSTGASMNPARSLGPAVIVSIYDLQGLGADIWEDHWVYWVGPLGAAIFGGVVYWIFDTIGSPDSRPKEHYVYSGSSNGYPDGKVLTGNRVVLNQPASDTVYNVAGLAHRHW